MEKRKQPLGDRALHTLIADLDHIFEAYDRGDETVTVTLDWRNWHVISRLAHEVAYKRQIPTPRLGSSIRAWRIAQGNYDMDEFFDT